MRHSYSSLKLWLACPAKFKAIRIDRCVPQETSPQMERGSRIHEALESAVRDGVDPSQVLRSEGASVPDGFVETLRASGARVEAGFGIGRDGSPARDVNKAWLRGYVDFIVSDGRCAVVGDYKSGKFNPDAFQADVYATLVRANGIAEQVEFHWVYVDAKRMHRVEVDMQAEARVRSVIQQVEDDTVFAPKPDHGCRWCPVESCRFNTKRGARSRGAYGPQTRIANDQAQAPERSDGRA